MAVILDTGFIGVHVLCGDVAEVPIRQASGLPTVLDLERTQGCKEVEDACTETSVGAMRGLGEVWSVGRTLAIGGVKFSSGRAHQARDED